MTTPNEITPPTNDMIAAGVKASLRGNPSTPMYVLEIWNAMSAAAPVAQEPVADAYSANEGETWHDCPHDIEFVQGMKVGDEFELKASVRAWPERFRVTKVPDETSDDYEVEPVFIRTAPVAAQAQPTIKESLTVEQPVSGADGLLEGETCQRCQGNGEIVTDWERYKNPRPGDVGDEAVAECPDCDGSGTVDAQPQPSGNAGWGANEVRVGEMTPQRSAWFLERFKREEKLLGPNEQWALEFAIAALAAQASGQDREDAGRYRWLRDTPAVSSSISGAIQVIFKLRLPSPGLDAVIAAARAAAKGEA